ncbi:MAG: adenylate/guanylate cyclase domain-containing protein [Planctomycetota bacterium]|nr:adenylate/guanylate cyclase domain-containing protein [Planctomycetota bacterium]MDA0921625.1 adenylate/guanylate cyclase domain-containing protein [Planctomycetota bacterium]
MLELMVNGVEANQQWRREIPAGEVIRIGRAPRSGWAVPWDLLISREHCEIVLKGQSIGVKRLDAARNPVYLNEVDTREFNISPGQGFRIGQTMFQLVSVGMDDGLSASHLEEQSFGPDLLKQFKFQNAEERLDVLAKLPEAISATRTDKELAQAAIKVMLDAMPHAQAAACVRYPPNMTVDDDPLMMQWDSRRDDIGRFSPSRRLIAAAIERAEGILHIWQDTDDSNPAFTVTGNLDWAFCIPFKGEHSKGWALYVSGQFGSPGASAIGETDLKGDLRFTELISDLIGSIRQVKTLESQQAGLAQFFSPAVIEAIRTAGTQDILAPREKDITVLFCDVRGFSRKSEEAKDNLRELLDRVSEALGVMTAGIIRYDGVIADFQGDAALGFWGWPSDNEEGPIAACRAAIHIHQAFRAAMSNPRSPLFGFTVGVGISHGPAIAGRIGTTEQIKVGAFGPVVNMGARLETMSKQLKASIVIDEETASFVEKLGNDDLRCRKLARVRPVGMKTDMTVFELLPPSAMDNTISDDSIALYEKAVNAFINGNWQESVELFNRIPAEDRAKEFVTDFVTANANVPPANWDGVIHMTSK